MYRASFVVEVLPGVVLIASGYCAAFAAFRIMRKSSRGRARSALAWVWGFAMGLLATLLLSIAAAARPGASVSAQGFLGAFVGPFIGILYGKWVRAEKKKRRRPLDVAQIAPRQPSQ